MRQDQFMTSREGGGGGGGRESETYNSFKTDAGKTNNSNTAVPPLM